MARTADLGEYSSKRSDLNHADPRALVVDWKKNMARGGQEPPVDDDLITFAKNLMPRDKGGQGQLQPIVVRPMHDRKLEVIAGFRRMRAALYLIESGICPDFTIQYVTRRMTDAEAALANLSENLDRKELSPMETAQAIRSLNESYGMSFADIAKHLHRTASYVTRLVELTSLPEEIQKDVGANGGISVKAALAITELPAADQKAVFDDAKNKGTKVTASQIKDKRRKKQEETGGGKAVPRNLKHLKGFLVEVSGHAENADGIKLAKMLVAWLEGEKKDIAMQKEWYRNFPPKEESKF